MAVSKETPYQWSGGVFCMAMQTMSAAMAAASRAFFPRRMAPVKTEAKTSPVPGEERGMRGLKSYETVLPS